MHFKKDLLLSKVSLKIIDYTELNSTLNNINNVVGIVNSSEEDIFPIESYSIEEDIFINIIYEVKSLDSEVKSLNSIDFYVPDSSKLTLLCPNDLNISYYAFRNNYFKNSLSFFASVSQLEAFNCLNFTTQDINLTSIYTTTEYTGDGWSDQDTLYTSNIVIHSPQELNEAMELYEENRYE